MNLFYAKLDKLVQKESKLALAVLNRVMLLAIPFNRPHHAEILKLNQTTCRVKLPFLRKNKNHLGTVHACAMATIGEYAAGLILIRNFPISQNRLIMKSLEIQFFKQAKALVYSEASLENDVLKKISLELDKKHSSDIEVSSIIFAKNQEKVAEVKTVWQLKKWTKVTFK